MKKLFLLVSLTLFSVFSGFAQNTDIAVAFFDRVSAHYGSVEDYEADLIIRKGEDDPQSAAVIYKNPNFLRLDFSEPEEQVLCSNGEELVLYVPELQVAFVQTLKKHNNAALANMASEQGLNLLRKNYIISYVVGPEKVPLDENSSIYVTRLKLRWKTGKEGFREILLSIGENYMIRRIVGVTAGHERIQFDFDDITVDNGIPETRFDYDPPAAGNAIKNFLFEPEE